ncbi:MAG: DUF4352 domain-containing protein [Actinomadura rubrobrunea]|nr:DUF4352 domain-containing protein [Actinomadura rubrobrunea]
MKKIAVFVATLVALTACAPSTVTSAPDEEKSATSTKKARTSAKKAGAQSAKVGDTITLKGNDPDLKIATTVLKVVPRAKGKNEFFTPEEGHRFVAVQLLLKNVGSVAYDDSPGNGAVLIDTQDQQYNSGLEEVANGPSIGGSVKLAPGSSRKGYIVFSVPAKAEPAKFQFTLDSGFAGQTGEWRLR